MIAEKSTDKKSGSFWRELPILLVVAVAVALLVRSFVLQTFYIPSESMVPTLEINDRVLVNKLVYDFRSPHRGEVIVFEAPQAWRSNPEEKDFIKRVIAVGGDRVTCNTQGQVVVNGRALQEDYVNNEMGEEAQSCPHPFNVVVPKSRLWVQGDNRWHSGDSAQHTASGDDIMTATIDEDAVIGRAFALFWPFSRATWLSVPSTFDKVPSAAPSS